MAAPGSFLRRRARLLLAVAIAGNLAGAGGALYLLGGGKPLTVDEAVRRFRERPGAASVAERPGAPRTGVSPTPSARATSGGAPAKRPAARATGAAAGTLSRDLVEGVYVFATEGYEETDALSGQRHTYDSPTTMSVARAGCGYVWRWQPMNGRWDESEACRRSEGIVLQRFSMQHEFFRSRVRDDFTCGSDAVVMPAAPRAGRRWTFTCRSEDSTIATTVSVVGFETLRIGGSAARAVRIRYDTVMTGANEGTHVQERWLADADGLLLRMTTDVEAEIATPVGGTAHYEEHYRLDLTSLEPRR